MTAYFKSVQTITLAVGLLIVACESKQSEPPPSTKLGPAERVDKRPHAALTDITSATKLDAVRAAFNAHKGEARFLTLLSPT